MRFLTRTTLGASREVLGLALAVLATFLVGSHQANARGLTAAITYPANEAVNADLSQPIQWTSVANVQAYSRYVGTTVGAQDLVNTGEILQTSYLAARLPAGRTLKLNGIWRDTDIMFTLEASVSPSTIVVPADGASAFDTVQPFEWTAVPLARAHRLTIGTTPGANNLRDSGEIDVTKRFVPNAFRLTVPRSAMGFPPALPSGFGRGPRP